MDPGLISIMMGYGFMKANDIVHPANDRARELTDEITRLRYFIWAHEHLAWDKAINPGKETGLGVFPDISKIIAVRQLKCALRGMTSERQSLGGSQG